LVFCTCHHNGLRYFSSAQHRITRSLADAYIYTCTDLPHAFGDLDRFSNGFANPHGDTGVPGS
jgi:hypothetical protein